MIAWKYTFALPLALFALGCSGGGTGKPMADVKGKVTLDGNPLATGKIVFDEGPGIPATELDIRDGIYSGQTSVGSKTVRISAFKPAVPHKGAMKGPGSDTMQENMLPAKYHSASKETREVKAGGPNDFDFAVTSK